MEGRRRGDRGLLQEIGRKPGALGQITKTMQLAAIHAAGDEQPIDDGHVRMAVAEPRRRRGAAMSVAVTIEEIVAAVSVEFGIVDMDLRHGAAQHAAGQPGAPGRDLAGGEADAARLRRDRRRLRPRPDDRSATASGSSKPRSATDEAAGARADDLRYRFAAGLMRQPPVPPLPAPPAFGRGVALTRLALGYLRDFRDNTAARQLLVEALGYLAPETAGHREAA